jgi:integrase
VRQSLIAVDYAIHFSEPKTARSRRSIALDATTAAALRAHRASQLEARLAWGPAYEESGLVFTRENGAPIHPHSLSQAFERHCEKAGLPPIRFHDLRHTYATVALSAGVHPKVVSERLGHSRIAITLDIYSHVIPSLEEEAASRIASLILG